MRAYLTEFIGTFFLVLTIGMTVIGGTLLAPVAIGSMLMVMVYMGGHISGAHYNPAVTLAVWVRGKISAKDVIPYMICQVMGGIAAAFVVHILMGKTFSVAPSQSVIPLHAILVELFFTFALALVVLNVATAKSTAGNSYYGLAIGFTVLAAAYAGGAISGGAYNPAVGIGPNLVHMMRSQGSMAHTWIYLVGPFAGGLLAALVFKIQNPND